MKTSIRSRRFTNGMILFLVIILLLSVSSAFFLNRLSKKTSAILKENHYSVVYARDMSEVLKNINAEIITSFLSYENPDTSFINTEFMQFNESFRSEKDNITEIGEDQLVSGIETKYNDYHDSVVDFIKSPGSATKVLSLQERFNVLDQQLILLSQMNGKAIEEKTEAAKVSANKAALQMTIIGTLCFLIAYAFTFTFSSYFNERFIRLYNEIKEMASFNYSQRLHINGNDELTEISLVFNELLEKLNKNKQTKSINSKNDPFKDYRPDDIQKLKNYLLSIKSAEEQAIELISGFEKE